MSSRNPPQYHSPEVIREAKAIFESPRIPVEARLRKYRSEAIIEAQGIRINLFLPVIPTEATMILRTKEEVAFRTMSLLAVAVKGEGLEQPFVEKCVEDWGLQGHFTPMEQDFIDNISPNDQMRAQFSWRYEAAWAFLWALSFVERLTLPVGQCDAGEAMRFLDERGAKRFVAEAQLRGPQELLDQADLAYRYDWAAVECRVVRGGEPAGVDGEITVERHHAMRWLVGFDDVGWDDVSTDT